jgi:isopentenyl phosphate kinase
MPTEVGGTSSSSGSIGPRTLSVVKLGGSILTRKKAEERIRPKVLARLAAEIAGSSGPLVALHGAGSFGHPGAVRFGLAVAPPDGTPGRERARGSSIVSAEVRRLHLAVLRALVAAGARPWSVPAATIARNRAGAITALESGPFEEALHAGLLPVSFGDVVPDTSWGRSILSADTIAVELARRLPVRRVIFVSDVPGVLEPGITPKPTIVPEVTAALVARLTPRTGGPDVTGGIRGKASAMLEIGRLGADAGLISGLKDGLLARALRGETVPGSWVRAASP